ncbi:MAG TPA: HAD family hydrolase [Rhizobiales bacterium]|nr:HAD family hydrolase [Hyphomicrobiales bacterium]
MSLKALIFDVDGTLAETEEAHRVAFNRVFAENDLNWHWDRDLYGELLEITGGKERIRHFIHKNSPQDAKKFLEDDNLVVAMHTRKTQIYVDLVRTGEVPLRPGVERIIKEARAAGLKLAIATTTNLRPLQALFEGTLGLEALSWFEAVAAGDMVTHKKPSPDLYLMALEQLGLPPENCLAMEDSRNGLVSARRAGLETLITVNTYTQEQDFTGALCVVSDLGEPDRRLRVLSGPDADMPCIDVGVLEALHEAAMDKKRN